jgi:uncharacterized protein (DUF433 family)
MLLPNALVTRLSGKKPSRSNCRSRARSNNCSRAVAVSRSYETLFASIGELIVLRMDYRDRITIDPTIRFGKPCVRGTRIAVGDVLSYLASGMSEGEVVADFPQLSSDDIRACLAYAAERERRYVSVPTD